MTAATTRGQNMLPYIIDTCEFHNNVKTEIQKAAPNQISFANNY